MTDDQGWLARHRRRLMDGYAERSREKAAGRSLDSSTPGATTIAVWVLASLVHLLSFVVLAVGVWMVWVGPLLVRVPGAVLVLFGLLLVPKPRLARRLEGLGRDDLPEMFALLDHVAEHNRAPVPHLVRISTDFNAFASTVGRRRVLIVGAPLWVAHPLASRVALLGHELGHFAHRDLLSASWAGSAHRALEQWYAFVRDAGQTEDRWYADDDLDTVRPAQAVLRLLMLPFRLLVEGYLYLFDLLVASSSRSREYLADLDALAAAGSRGATESHDAILAEEAVEAAVRRAAIRGDDVWHEVTATLERDDLSTRLRRRAHAAQEQSRIDQTHPSTAQRIRIIEERDQVGPGVVVDTATW